MKRILLFFVCSAFSLLSFSQKKNQAYEHYIDKYQSIAMRQQREHRIPASIILAQGLLESSAGQSKLAKKANNHFGIKCAEWSGARVYHDDDHRNECFRKYKRVLDSYEDHSDFLVNRPRYASLFRLSPTDYKAWAKGLKKAGYATDPAYANKLISLIDTYDLHRFDLAAAKNRSANGGAAVDYKIHKTEKLNGIQSLIALPGDSYAAIASEFGLKEKKLLAYNDLDPGALLRPGTRVYLAKKKCKADKRSKLHTIQRGESLYSVSQQYGIRLKDLFKMNGWPNEQRAKVGMTVKLRP